MDADRILMLEYPWRCPSVEKSPAKNLLALAVWKATLTAVEIHRRSTEPSPFQRFIFHHFSFI